MGRISHNSDGEIITRVPEKIKEGRREAIPPVLQSSAQLCIMPPGQEELQYFLPLFGGHTFALYGVSQTDLVILRCTEAVVTDEIHPFDAGKLGQVVGNSFRFIQIITGYHGVADDDGLPQFIQSLECFVNDAVGNTGVGNMFFIIQTFNIKENKIGLFQNGKTFFIDDIAAGIDGDTDVRFVTQANHFQTKIRITGGLAAADGQAAARIVKKWLIPDNFIKYLLSTGFPPINLQGIKPAGRSALAATVALGSIDLHKTVGDRQGRLRT